MFENIISKIKEYDKIIIHRHTRPDMDAYGSQLGLKESIKLTFPDKEVYAVGDESNLKFIGEMDDISVDEYKGSLAIICDVAVDYLISDDRYKLADYVIVIDHHLNDANVGDLVHIDSSYGAAALLITEMISQTELEINEKVATYLYGGVITDTGRFLYSSTNELTFKLSTYLVENGARMQYLYENIYKESIEMKHLKGHALSNFKVTENNVAYLKNTKDLKSKYNVTTFQVSRMLVNQMSGIEGVPIWVNFTEEDNDEIYVEIRSKKHPVVEVAKKYGGGGHLVACGCKLKDFNEVDDLLADLNELAQKEV
ncbi:bifunctional oligoribonuclease/PAP phosphatase NrnA [Mycoplasmatota bacterium WC44]